MDDYRVDLDIYHGPLDLLLYLIRRDEIDIQDIPIARITGQFILYIELIKLIDPESIGDFLVMAATLMEIKSRSLLPVPPPEEEDGEFVDPRVELVKQLLEYKAIKDAARLMEDTARVQALRHPREPVFPDHQGDDVEIDDLGIWDLLEAFNRLLAQTGQGAGRHTVVHDDTPILIYIDDILETLEQEEGATKFATIFTGRSRFAMIGLFLALLELIRQKRIRAAQDEIFGEITLVLLDATPIDDLDGAYDYAQSPSADEANNMVEDLDDDDNGTPDSDVTDITLDVEINKKDTAIDNSVSVEEEDTAGHEVQSSVIVESSLRSDADVQIKSNDATIDATNINDPSDINVTPSTLKSEDHTHPREA